MRVTLQKRKQTKQNLLHKLSFLFSGLFLASVLVRSLNEKSLHVIKPSQKLILKFSFCSVILLKRNLYCIVNSGYIILLYSYEYV